jgi:uncharacterized protein DUF6894
MRRYFFDLRHGAQMVPDEEGILLPNLSAVQAEAMHSLIIVARDFLNYPGPITVEVRDDAGSVMRARISFEFDRTN